MSQNIETQVIAIIAEQAVLEPGDVQPEASLEDLGIDVPFNANDPTDSAFDISSVGAIAKAVEALIADQKS
jgi:acyl carrier protein